jgi:hypothetical protein
LRTLRGGPELGCDSGCRVTVDIGDYDVEPPVHELAGEGQPDPDAPPVTIALTAIPAPIRPDVAVTTCADLSLAR